MECRHPAAPVLAARHHRGATLLRASVRPCGYRLGERRHLDLPLPGTAAQPPAGSTTWHCHVAYLIAAGSNFYAIQQRLGRASIRITFDVYGHLLPSGDVCTTRGTRPATADRSAGTSVRCPAGLDCASFDTGRRPADRPGAADRLRAREQTGLGVPCGGEGRGKGTPCAGAMPSVLLLWPHAEPGSDRHASTGRPTEPAPPTFIGGSSMNPVGRA